MEVNKVKRPLEGLRLLVYVGWRVPRTRDTAIETAEATTVPPPCLCLLPIVATWLQCSRLLSTPLGPSVDALFTLYGRYENLR